MADDLWALREQKKLSVAALANRAGLPIGLIMEYESGQRSIDPRHLSRLARALYVDDAEIKLHSDPRPGAAPLERQPRQESKSPDRVGPPAAVPSRPDEAEGSAPGPRPKERPPRPKPEPRPPVPPRPSQVAHLEGLLKRLGRSQQELEAELGKRVADLDRVGMSELLKTLQEQVREATAERHRAYLPESVDGFEARYLTAAQEACDTLHFTLFDGQTADGQVIGFGPYSITVRLDDGTELTLNKLALVSYARAPGKTGGKELSV